MAYITANEYKDYIPKDTLVDVVYEVVSLVKNKDYSLAYENMLKNKISFSLLIERTQRLKLSDLTKFADYVISHARQ